jgi:hypothetical protein
MTVPSATNRVNYTGNGVTVALSFPYIVYDEADLEVYLDGVLQSSGYSVAGVGTASVTVTFDTAPLSGVSILIKRVVGLTQDTNFENFDGNPSDVTEKQFDLIVMMAQEIADGVNRSIKLREDDPTSSVELPLVVDRANKFLAFDYNGNPVASAGPTSGGTPFGATGIDLAATNTPADARAVLDSPSLSGANNFSAVNNFSTRVNTAKGADLASASTVNIGAATGNYIDITGTTTITAFDSVAAGAIRILKFEGVLTLTHNATSLILPTGSNITTAVGDTFVFVSEGSGNWRCIGYCLANGRALSQPASGGQAQAWAYVTYSAGTPTLQDSFNVSGITDLGDGNLRVSFTTPFASANYAANVTPREDGFAIFGQVQSQATGSIDIYTFQFSTGNPVDPDAVSVVCFGDQ